MVVQFNNKKVGKTILNGTFTVIWDGSVDTIILVNMDNHIEHYRFTGKQASDLYSECFFVVNKGRP